MQLWLLKHWFEKYTNIPTEVDIASEYRYRSHPDIQGEGIIVISQSGETADTLAALSNAKKKYKIFGNCKRIESSISFS